MTVKDSLARLRAGLDRDEAIARAAIGKRGSEAGAVTQHWQWDLVADDEIVLTDGSAPIDVAYCYADEVEKVEGLAILVTAERYPARVADWQLPDQLLPGVEELHAGAAQHIARHDPVRVADQYVPAIRQAIAEHAPADGFCTTCRVFDEASREYLTVDFPCPTVHALASIYPEGSSDGDR